MNIMQGGEGCHETNLAIWGGAVVPNELINYTDGYMMGVEIIINESLDPNDHIGTCFWTEEDTQGYFCYYLYAGEDEYLFNKH